MKGKKINVLPKRVELSLDKFAAEAEGWSFKDQIMFISVNQLNIDKFQKVIKDFPPVQVNVLNFILVLDGKVSITIDYIDHVFEKNTWIAISPFNTITSVQISPECRYYLMMVKMQFGQEAMQWRQLIPVERFIKMDIKPGTQLTDTEMASVKKSMDLIYSFIKQKDNQYLEQILHSAFYIFVLNLANIFFERAKKMGPSGKLEESGTKIDARREILFRNFMGLIREHGDVEHNPSFYADKLCISVQYLSLILRDLTDNTAKHWISNHLIQRAKTMLRTPEITIQQVADELHFADQSSFGKFFKKHVGLSPKQYLEQI